MTDNAVIEFRKRREKRLSARGYRTKLNEYRNANSGKMAEKQEESVKPDESGTFNMDAPADDKSIKSLSRDGHRDEFISHRQIVGDLTQGYKALLARHCVKNYDR